MTNNDEYNDEYLCLDFLIEVIMPDIRISSSLNPDDSPVFKITSLIIDMYCIENNFSIL